MILSFNLQSRLLKGLEIDDYMMGFVLNVCGGGRVRENNVVHQSPPDIISTGLNERYDKIRSLELCNNVKSRGYATTSFISSSVKSSAYYLITGLA